MMTKIAFFMVLFISCVNENTKHIDDNASSLLMNTEENYVKHDSIL